MNDSSVRETIREWLEGEVEDCEVFDLPDAASRGFAALRQDKDFCERFLDECLRPMIYSVGMGMLTQRRGQVVRAMDAPRTVKHGASHVAAVIEHEAKPADWSKWMEFDPSTNRHVALFSMTKEQALAAAEFREKRTDADLHRAGLLRLAAGKLLPGQRIAEVWTADELADIEARLEVSRPTYSLGHGTIFELMKGAA